MSFSTEPLADRGCTEQKEDDPYVSGNSPGTDNDYHKRKGLRAKADFARKHRCTTLIVVLENPKDLRNIGTVVRNIDTLGAAKLYVVDEHGIMPDDWQFMRTSNTLNTVSSSAIKWSFVKRFDSTADCIAHLKRKNVTSIVTSPHDQPTCPRNRYLKDFEFANSHLKHIAIWFGNESRGISAEAVANAYANVRIFSCGIIESMNLATSTGIVVWRAATQRREFVRHRKIRRAYRARRAKEAAADIRTALTRFQRIEGLHNVAAELGIPRGVELPVLHSPTTASRKMAELALQYRKKEPRSGDGGGGGGGGGAAAAST